MKHEEISFYTKRTIAESLKKIMRHKPFSKITVSEIIADCEVNRKTFYYHFDDIYDLLKWMFQEEASGLAQNFHLIVHYEEAIRYVMDYVERNDYLLRCVEDSLGRDVMKHFFYANFEGVTAAIVEEAEEAKGMDIEPELKAFAVKFYTEAVSSSILDWVRDQHRVDRENIIGYLTVLIENALYSMGKLTRRTGEDGTERTI